MPDYLTQHWKVQPAKDKVGASAPEIRTLQNGLLICRTDDADLAAHIVKTHNQSLIHPDKLIRSVEHLLTAMDCQLDSIPSPVLRLMEETRANLRSEA